MSVPGVAIEAHDFGGERRMLPALLDWLEATKRIRPGTAVAEELPWRGRRVDLSTLTATGSASAYELKLGNVSRVLEQAIYNTMSFDRSWVVVDREPSGAHLELARRYGVGVLVVSDRVAVVHFASKRAVNPILRSRLRLKLTREGAIHV